MCMEDLMIGRSIVKERFNVSVGLAVVQLCHADENRYALAIATDGVALVWLSDSPDMVAGQGIPIKAADHPLTLCVTEYGNWVRSGLWVIGAAAGPTQVGMLSASFEPELFVQARHQLKGYTA